MRANDELIVIVICNVWALDPENLFGCCIMNNYDLLRTCGLLASMVVGQLMQCMSLNVVLC